MQGRRTSTQSSSNILYFLFYPLLEGSASFICYIIAHERCRQIYIYKCCKRKRKNGAIETYSDDEDDGCVYKKKVNSFSHNTPLFFIHIIMVVNCTHSNY